MAGIKQIRSLKPPLSASDNQMMIVLSDGRRLELSKAQLALQNTEGKLDQVIKATLGEPIFVHLNRNGRYAIATGERPVVWPEDEVEAKTRVKMSSFSKPKLGFIIITAASVCAEVAGILSLWWKMQ